MRIIDKHLLPQLSSQLASLCSEMITLEGSLLKGPLATHRQFPGTFSEICRRKIAQNLLLLSKRKHLIIPVGNLKVDSP